MSEKPKVGDTVTLCAVICNYNSNGTALLELKDAIIVETSEPLTPPSPTPLELGIPTVTLGEGSVIWSAVTGATSYEFYIGTSRFEFDTPTRIPLEAGDTFKVRALGDGTTYEAAGEWSAVYTYTVQKTALETPVVNLNEALASWAAVSGATAYEVKIGSAAPIRVTATNYTLKSGDTISVRAIADTASNYLDSAWSVAVTYTAAGECNHTDTDNNGKCDSCQISVVVVVDFYSINDLHGKFCDSNTQPGVDELASYLKGRESIDDNVVVLSAGDMWQGTAESSLTYGKLMTEWMNIIGTVGMTLGNHEYDWGEDYIRENLKIADFPFLAINIYDRSTGELADYCTPSVMIEEGGIEIGIIGAIGDCYSSILSTMVAGVEFKTGSALTSLVKAESERLREAGADIIVYTWHSSTSGYDYSLSSGGYVDLVFEGHSHTTYCNEDSYGVFHIQAGGENQGISHAELSYNIATKKLTTTEANIIASSTYSAYEDDADTEALEDKYGEIIDAVTTPLGTVDSYMSSDAVTDLVAKLCFEAGVKRWGSRYTITLGGAYLQTRSPYSLSAGTVTYGDLFSLLPFNNQLVLCSIKGSDLISRFINASGNYHVYFEVASSSIDRNATYYVVTDTYTSTYAQNNMTEIEYYDDTTYARDLLAEYIKTGSVGTGGSGSGSGNTVVAPTP